MCPGILALGCPVWCIGIAEQCWQTREVNVIGIIGYCRHVIVFHDDKWNVCSLKEKLTSFHTAYQP